MCIRDSATRTGRDLRYATICPLLYALCSCSHTSHSLASKSVALKDMSEMTDNFECLIQGLMDDEYGIVHDFISPALVIRLRNNLLARLALGRMSQGGVGQQSSFQENNAVRRDKISWIEDDQSDSGEEEYFRLLWNLVDYLNLCLLYTSPSPRDRTRSRMPSSA